MLEKHCMVMGRPGLFYILSVLEPSHFTTKEK